MDYIFLTIYLNEGVVKVRIDYQMAQKIDKAMKENSKETVSEYFHNLIDIVSDEKFDINFDDIEGFELRLEDNTYDTP